MKWICFFLCSLELLAASNENQLLENASALSPIDLEIIVSNPDELYVYMPEELIENIKQAQNTLVGDVSTLSVQIFVLKTIRN